MPGKGSPQGATKMTAKPDTTDDLATAAEATDIQTQDEGDRPEAAPCAADPGTPQPDATPSEEIGGPQGPEPTRYGAWERKGRCIDF